MSIITSALFSNIGTETLFLLIYCMYVCMYLLEFVQNEWLGIAEAMLTGVMHTVMFHTIMTVIGGVGLGGGQYVVVMTDVQVTSMEYVASILHT